MNAFGTNDERVVQNLLLASKTHKNGNFSKERRFVAFGFCNQNFLFSTYQMGKVSTNSVNTQQLAKWSGNETHTTRKKKQTNKEKRNELRYAAGTDGVIESSLVRENIFSST
jgi:hypothetical protein